MKRVLCGPRSVVHIRYAVGLGLFLYLIMGHGPQTTLAWASTKQLKQANRLFKKGDYEGALKKYDDALVDAPHSSVLHFNAGDAAYQKGDFTRAQKEFEEAAHSAIPALRSAAHYNRGNSLFRQQRYADAAEAYKESLRANPGDEDAKYNLSVALEAIQNPPKNKQNGGSSSSSSSASQDQKKSGGGQSSSSGGSSSAAGAGASSSQGMSREDAERLLSAARSGELKKSNQKFPKTDVPRPDEDW